MSKPTTQDAQALLTLMDIFLSDSVREARKWCRTLPDGLSLEEFEKRFPRGSEGWEHFSTMAIFWETAELPHAPGTHRRGSRLRHVHGCPAMGEGRANHWGPSQAREGPG